MHIFIMYAHLGHLVFFFMRYPTICIKIGRGRQFLTKCLYISVILVFIYYYSIYYFELAFLFIFSINSSTLHRNKK